jgi:hypothetical protein
MNKVWEEIREQFKKGQYLQQEYLLVFLDLGTFEPSYVFTKDVTDFWMQYESLKKNSFLKLIYTYDLKAQTLEDVAPGTSDMQIPARPILLTDLMITCEMNVYGTVIYRFIQNGTTLGAYEVSEEFLHSMMSSGHMHTDFKMWALEQWASKNNIDIRRGDPNVHIIS